MASTYHPHRDAQHADWALFCFPGARGEPWTLRVPQPLACCVGRYARIPEYALHGALLETHRVVGRRPD